MSDEPWD